MFDSALRQFGFARTQRASAVLGILIVVVIILVIVMMGPFRTDPKTQVNQAVRDIEKAATSTCMMNRRMAQTEVDSLRINNNGEIPPKPVLEQRLSPYKCPRGGAIVIGTDLKIYCTKHDPPPIEQLKDMVTLFEPEPEATPPPLPQVTPMH